MEMVTKLIFLVVIQLFSLSDDVIARRHHYKERSSQVDNGYDRGAWNLANPHIRDWRLYHRDGRDLVDYHRDYDEGRFRHDDGYEYDNNARRETFRSRYWSLWDREGWKRKSHQSYKYKKHGLATAPVMMPSGKMMNISIPGSSSHWNCGGYGNKAKFIYLSPKGKRGKIEYNIVKDEFVNTWGTAFLHQVLKIQKIKNSCLWQRYLYRKKQILAETTEANERLLFHGSKDPTPYKLTYSGFDERLTSMSSGAWGAGFYFAENSSKTHGYTAVEADGSRKMLLCRVLLGKMNTTNVKAVLAHPPVGFHSVKGNVGQVEYIVYRGEQIYPEYLITYI